MKTACVLLFLLAYIASSAQQTPACVCCGEKSQQFAFWIGTWKVYTADGKLAGTNRILSITDSCVIHENWTSANNGFTGTSLNFFNRQTNKWEQLWIDNAGSHLHLEGEFASGKMIMQTKKTTATLPDQLDRITWTANADGTLRQVWDKSKDKGKTWSTAFDGRYRKE